MFGLTNTNGQYPIFVYGTLRFGEQNYDVLRGRTTTELHAHTTDMELYAVGAFPMMVAGEGVVHGDFMQLHSFLYRQVLEELDRIEGYNPSKREESVYRRELVTITINATNQPRLAWAYVGQAYQIDNGCTHIQSGDWVKYRFKSMQKTRFGRYLKDFPAERKLPECQ